MWDEDTRTGLVRRGILYTKVWAEIEDIESQDIIDRFEKTLTPGTNVHNLYILLKSGINRDNPNIPNINSISNKEFKRRYKDRAFSWRGKNIIKRNIDILKESL